MGNFPLPWGNDVENQRENFVLEALVKISTFIFLLANAFSSKTITWRGNSTKLVERDKPERVYRKRLIL